MGYAATGSKEGELAVFCVACPQPGINMPSNWNVHPNQYEHIFYDFEGMLTQSLDFFGDGRLLQMAFFQLTILRQLLVDQVLIIG